jgi:hypothetical protein
MGEPVIYFADSALFLSDLIMKTSRIPVLSYLSLPDRQGKLYQGEGVFSLSELHPWAYRLRLLTYGGLIISPPTGLRNFSINFFHKVCLWTSPCKKQNSVFKNASKEKRLPYYWAASIVAGKSEILVRNQGNSWPWELLIILIAGLISILVWRRVTTIRKPDKIY